MADALRVLRTARDRLPESISSRLRPSHYRYSPGDIPSLPPGPDKPVRVLIGPANYAAQGNNIARSLERDETVGVTSLQFSRTNGYTFPSDITIPINAGRYSGAWQRRLFREVTENYTHVLIEASIPMFGAIFPGGILEEVEKLRAKGITVGMVAYGSELRLPSRHRASSPHSPFHDRSWTAQDQMEIVATRTAELLARANAPVFVATPDMLLDWPAATWLPIIVDTEKWVVGPPPLERERPIVVHAPTNAVLKGSDRIEPTMQRMHDAGLIEYRRVQGIAAADMPAFYGSADIVLDQFLLGNYATAAIESLSTGRLVIAHVDEQVRAHVLASSGREVPVVEATTDTLESVITGILADRPRFRRIAAIGPDFVRGLHDGSATAGILGTFLHGK